MKPFARPRFVACGAAAAFALTTIAFAGQPSFAFDVNGKQADSDSKERHEVSAEVSLPGLIGNLFGFGSRSEHAVTDANATHEFRKAVTVKSSDGTSGVQTFCIDGRGRIVALVGTSRNHSDSANGLAEVHVLTSDGEPVMHWKLDFCGQSINTDPDGNVYVAGDGTIAQFTPDGTTLRKLALPHIAEMLKDEKSIRKQAEEQVRQQSKSFDQITGQYKERIKKLESKPADKLERYEKRQLTQYRELLKSLEKDIGEQTKGPDLDTMVKSITSGLRIINSVAVSERDVFIVCGERTGYGYALWRMDHDFKNPKQVMNGLRGCCGQMDVQVQGNDLLLAANCEHAFARFDRDGKKLGQWGQRSQSEDLKCFGGCCNPMNVRSGPNGDVLTAESEGLIKRFSAKGEFISLIGKRPLSGGCKNVAVATSVDGKRIYFCDQPQSQIIILAEKSKTVGQVRPPAK